MSTVGSYDRTAFLGEVNTPLETQGSGVMTTAQQQAAILANLAGTAMTAAQLAAVAGVTPGTAAASKALVLGASKEIATITSATITTLTSTTVNASGVVTATGGVAAAGGYSVSPRLMNTGANPPSVSTDFTDLTVVVTETYRVEIYVPANTSSTGVAIFNGSAVAGNVQAFLLDSTGAVVTGVQTVSTAASGTDAYQRIAWSGGPYVLKGPATYWLAVQGNNTGMKFNTHTIGNFGADKQTGTVFGTITVAASPTTFTTALGPVAGLY